MSNKFERSAGDANRQESVDQLERVIKLGLTHYFKKRGRFIAETEEGIGYVALSKAGIEGLSLWLSRDEYREFHALNRPNNLWTLSRHIYLADTDDGSMKVDLLEASSSALPVDSTDELVAFATFFKHAGTDVRRIPKKINHFYL